jgi:ATP-dependent helicase/nuclease subunit A
LLVGKAGQQPERIRQWLEQEKGEQQRESANLLYVALTRARQLLYISGVKPKKGEATGWYGQLRQALDPLEECPADTPVTLETGAPPTAAVVQEPAPRPEVTFPAALVQPFQLDHPVTEIAPSHQGDSGRFSNASGDEDGRLRGTVIHRLLERMTDADTDTETLRRAIAAEFDLEEEDEAYGAWFDECRRLLANDQLANIFRPAPGVESLNEVPIIYEHDGHTVYGVIDRLLLHEDELWLVDYKSHHYADRHNLVELGEHYRRQMDYYAAGLSRLWPQRRVRRFLLFTAPQRLYELESATP